MTADPQPLQDQARQIAQLMPALVRRLMSQDDDPLAELPLGQLRVCGILREGLRSMSELSRELGVSLSAMTQLADRLERAELVRRVVVGSDRRVRSLQLTAHAEQLMRRRDQGRVARVAEVLQRLPPETCAAVLAAMQALSQVCQAPATTPAGEPQAVE